MRLPIFVLALVFLLCFGIINPTRANSRSLCQVDQKIKLLQLKKGLTYNSSHSTKLVTWNQSMNCCVWKGVTCNYGGYIIGLDLSDESIVHGIDNPSLFSLQFLESFDLSFNYFYGAKIPSRFNNLTRLTSLSLRGAGFSGQVPSLSQLRGLVMLDLSNLYHAGPIQLELVTPNLKSFVQNLTELRELYLGGVNISSQGSEWCQALSSSLSNLQVLGLSNCSLFGPIHSSLSKLSTLSKIYLAWNNLSTHVPLFFMNYTRLTHLILAFCNLKGEFPREIFQLPRLEYLDLHDNKLLGGSLPEFSNNKNISGLWLAETNFSGTLPRSLGNLVMLSSLQMFNCNFSGQIPKSISQLSQLQFLDLSHNMFNGPIPSFEGHPNLDTIDLSSNLFNGSMPFSTFTVPNLKFIDLSNNQISGPIPNWLWKLGSGQLNYLNLSCNFLVGLQQPYVVPSTIILLDLHSNQLEGEIPLLPHGAQYVDLSGNSFSSPIPAHIGENLHEMFFFSISNDYLSGTIPKSICNMSSLQVLDLSNNSLSGKIPTCLLEMGTTLEVLNLAENNLIGNISDTFPRSCGLRSLDLNGNILEGQVPKSLTNCTHLRILNLGNNRINDTFPSFLGESPNLHVLVLQANNFHGKVQCGKKESWPRLQIINIAFNYYTGDLTSDCFSSLRGMIDVGHSSQVRSELDSTELYKVRSEFHRTELHQVFTELHKTELDQVLVKLYNNLDYYYQDSVVIVNKWIEMTLSKIWTSFTLVDFSNNNFSGTIPQTIGNLNSLRALNLSNNSFKGTIPTSIGNLRELETLDVSLNELSGEIPTELATLTFLSSLNLSCNQLVGMIPKGSQIETFSATSFQGNKGLCGWPLETDCREHEEVKSPPRPMLIQDSFPKTKIDWNIVKAIVLGYVVGMTVVIVPLLFCKRLRTWYYKKVGPILLAILSEKNYVIKIHQRKSHRNTIRRL